MPDVYPAMPDGAVRALPVLERALALEPDYALAHGFAGTIAGVHGRFEPYYGAYGPPQSWEAVIGGVIGFVCGIIAAGLICGFVALIITISRELNLIRDRLAYPPIVSAPPPRI